MRLKRIAGEHRINGKGQPIGQLSKQQRRRAMGVAQLNAALWGLGNGLASTTLIIYLALALNAKGTAVGLIVAAPSFVGVLRLVTPAMIGWLGDRKRVSVAGYLLSTLFLVLIPWAAAPGRLASPAASLAALVMLWSIYHLCEYIATVSLWSWIRSIVPTRVRGRFVGRRERWLVVGRMVGMLAAGLYVWNWLEHSAHVESDRWLAYIVPAISGAAVMFLAALVLLAMPHSQDPPMRGVPLANASQESRSEESSRRAQDVTSSATRFHWRDILHALGNKPLRRLLLFSAWFGLVNGVTQTSQAIYPYRMLGFGLLTMLSIRTGMRLGQTSAAASVGRLIDRVGNRTVLIWSQLLVACGPLWFMLATPDARWWIVGAWVFWVAYVGLNIGLPNLLLGVSSAERSSTDIALNFSISGICFGLGSIAGGLLFDWLSGEAKQPTLAAYRWLFLSGASLRALGILFLWRLIEPAKSNCTER